MNNHPLFPRPINGHRRLTRWLPMLLWMAAIFAISAQTPQELPNLGAWDLLGKKLAHFIAYAILALLALWGSGGSKQLAPLYSLGAGSSKEWWPFLLAFLITFLYAVSDEYHQTFVPGRNGNAWDVLIDSCGGMTALFGVWWWGRRLKSKRIAMPMID